MEKIFNIYEGQSCSMVIICDGKGRRFLYPGTEEDVSVHDDADFSRVLMEAGAGLNMVYIVMPGAVADIGLTVDLDGKGAEVTVSGIYLCDGQDRLSIRMDVRHNVPDCRSRQLFKGLASGTSSTDFYGRITVAQDAQKTEAYQENHSIILSDGAKVETRPQLEIYADDVRCSHGATVGRLNEEEQFYMRSRGIPADEARVLQMISFLSPVMDNIEDVRTREIVMETVSAAVRTL